MEVKLLNAPDDAEELICRACRNDYTDEGVGEKSFEEVMEGVDGDTVEEQKTNLIHKILKRGHFGPAEHPHISVSIEGISRSCMAQITRHRHASFDVTSMRYVSMEDASVKEPPTIDSSEMGRNSTAEDYIEQYNDTAISQLRKEAFDNAVDGSIDWYRTLLEYGVPPEDARFVLPIGTKVNVVMTMNVRALLHLADMRAAADSQWEIREVTEGVLSIAEDVCPIVMDYYEENMKGRRNRLAP